MKSKLNLSQSKDLILNPVIQEEILIKNLVDEIYNAEKKISEINNPKENSQNGLNLNNQKLLELKALQKNLEKNLILLNNNFQSEISSNESKILSQKSLLNDLDISINEHQNKILNFNAIDFKSPLLTKYALENDFKNKILSQEKINDFYLKNKSKKENEIKQLTKEIEINKASESVIINNKKEINKRLEQINENLKMLKEEKLSINDELIDILSFKESLEYINKNNFLKIIKKMDLNNNINVNKLENNINSNEDEEEEDILPIKIYLYELEIIDPNKTVS